MTIEERAASDAWELAALIEVRPEISDDVTALITAMLLKFYYFGSADTYLDLKQELEALL